MQSIEGDIHLKLLAGMPIEISGIGEFTPLTMREIIKMGESIYNKKLSALLFDKKTLDSNEMDELSNFEAITVFLYYDKSFRDLFFCALKMYLCVDVSINEDGQILLMKNNKEIVLDENLFNEIQKIAKLANLIKNVKEDEYEAGNERARKFIEKLKKKKEKLSRANSAQKINLHSLISGLAWRSSYNDVLNLTIYQLYDGFQRIEKINDYEYTLLGIYTGNIDGKKIKLPDINWANVIKS